MTDKYSFYKDYHPVSQAGEVGLAGQQVSAVEVRGLANGLVNHAKRRCAMLGSKAQGHQLKLALSAWSLVLPVWGQLNVFPA